jgi:hypothetical protein
MTLSPTQRETLKRAYEGGGLRRIPGGFWIPNISKAQTAEELLARINREAPPWYAGTQMVRSLEKRRLLTRGSFLMPRFVTKEGIEALNEAAPQSTPGGATPGGTGTDDARFVCPDCGARSSAHFARGLELWARCGGCGKEFCVTAAPSPSATPTGKEGD